MKLKEIKERRKFMQNTYKYQGVLIGLGVAKLKLEFYKGLYKRKVFRKLLGGGLKKIITEKREIVRELEDYKKYPETLFGISKFKKGEQ